MAEQQPALIRAMPNLVPSVAPPGMGLTTVEWATGDGSPGVVYVQEGEGEEQLFARGAEGRQDATWIHPRRPSTSASTPTRSANGSSTPPPSSWNIRR